MNFETLKQGRKEREVREEQRMSSYGNRKFCFTSSFSFECFVVNFIHLKE